MPKVSTKPRNSSSSAVRSTSRRSAKVTSPATASSADLPPDEYNFDFGRFRGKTLDQAGSWYVQYCIRNDIGSQRPALGAAIRRWQARRSGGSVQILDSNDIRRLLDPDRRRRARILQRVPQWLYIECVCALSWGMKKAEYNECGEDTDLWLLNENDGWKRMEGMAKSDFPLQYPPRPSVSDSLPESASVRRFRELMLTFPKCDYTEGRCQGVLQGTEHVREQHDGWHLTDWYVLTEEYEDTIKLHLRAIEKEHGKEARAIANWEVRDKYAENIQGVEWYEGDYPPARFFDHSVHWLL